MIAAVLTGYGGLDKLEIRNDYPVPQPQLGEVMIRVAACGVNNTDINTRIGWYNDNVATGTNESGVRGFHDVAHESAGGWSGTIQFPRIQGADICGHVVATGAGVPDEWLGTRVINDPWLRDWDEPLNLEKTGYIGSECDGGFAQYVALPITNLGRIQSDWSDAELATLSCAYTTAENMLNRARVSTDDSVLVTGASGGVGSALIQLAKRREATVIALTNESKAEQVQAIGPDALICRGLDNWEEVIRSVTGSAKVNVAADVVGGPVFQQLMNVLARRGRYVTSGAIGGKTAEIDLSHLYLNDWSLIGSTVTETNVFPDLIRYVENNEIRPLVAGTYPLEEIHQAQMDFLEKKHVGKLVLVPPVTEVD
ncbi:alcohol dehydrogenase family protein [Chloroflexi bacterium TSY]|nr:alcohol dehydrogenase family protein [Chloroflexi bacterium TSY]